jgi:hypothetical protein
MTISFRIARGVRTTSRSTAGTTDFFKIKNREFSSSSSSQSSHPEVID